MIKSFFGSFAPLLFLLLIWCTTGNAKANSVESKDSAKISASKTQERLSIEKEIFAAKEKGDKNSIHRGYIVLGKNHLQNQNLDEAINALNAAHLISTELNLAPVKYEATKLLSEVYLAKENRQKALEYLHKGLELNILLKDSINTGWFYLRLAEENLVSGMVGQALEMALKAKSYFVIHNDTTNLIYTLLNLSSIHNQLGNEIASEQYLDETSKLVKGIDNNVVIAHFKLGWSQLKILQGKFTEANKFGEEAVELLESISPKETYRAKSLVGEVYYHLKNYTKAQIYLTEAIDNQQLLNDQSGLALTYLRMANLYRALANWSQSLEYYDKGLGLATNVGLTDVVIQAYKGLSQVYSIAGNSEAAYRFLDNYTQLTDSLFNTQKISEANKVEENAIHHQSLLELRIKENELEKFKGLVKQQKRNQGLLATVTVMFFVILILSIREFIQKNRANELLVKQKAEIEHQKQLADRKTRNFTDSLNYSQRIQKAILRTSLTIQNLFPESFIILFPKDIVSGDFYWIKEKNERILFALADCTGHGVPGALMSIIGTFGLNQVVNELNITSPSEILTNINDIFRENLIRKESTEIFDGMDIAICCYNPKTKELMYSGANIPLHICRSNLLPQPSSAISAKGKTHTLFNVKPAKQNIGSNIETEPFKNHSISLLEGDVIYLFSDGYADQFGGVEGRKFKSTQLYKLLVGITNLSLDEQKMLLETTFIAWKGDHNQLDDMSFMGIRI